MTNKMEKFVEDLKDKHTGKEIWIIGTGKSLDDFPLNFFDDKISIAMNGAIWKYGNCTYWLGHHEVWRIFFRDEKPDLLEKCIIGYPFPGPFKEKRIRNPEEFFDDLTSLPYWLHYLDAGIMSEKIISNVLNDIKKLPKVNFRAIQSVIHLAIEVAFLMGASKITLVGCENEKFGDWPTHADFGRKYPSYMPYKKLQKVDETNMWFAEILKKEYNVLLQKYFNKTTQYYKKGYQNI